jgi:hypothetical protein
VRHYRYSLTSIDVMFAAVAQPAEVVRARDRRDRQAAYIVFTFSLVALVASMIGLGMALKIVFQSASDWLV